MDQEDKITQLEEQLTAKEAEAAALREHLPIISQQIRDRALMSDLQFTTMRLMNSWAEVIDRALASNAGADLLARLNRVEMKLAQREEMLVDEHSVLCVTMNKWITEESKALLARAEAAEEKAAALEAAADPFARMFFVSIEPFLSHGHVDLEDGIRHMIPQVWPTVADAKRLAAAIQARAKEPT